MSKRLIPSRRAQAIEPTLIRALRSGMGPSTIDFGLGQTDLEVSEAIRRHFRASLNEPMRAPYTPNAGLLWARKAVAQHAGVKPQEVMLTCGVQQGLAVAILGLCDPGDEVLIPDPGFPAYANLVRAAGGRPIGVPLGKPTEELPGWGLDVAAMRQRIGPDTKLAILNNPANPTGSVFGRSEMTAVLKLFDEHDIGWISDEIYEEYVWSGQFASARTLSGDPDAGIVVSGPSKSHHMMGWRIGWMIGPAETLRQLTPLHQHMVTCAPLPAQEAIVAALGDHEHALAATRKIFAARRQKVLDAFADIGLGSPPVAQGAFYIFLDLRPWGANFATTAELAQALLDEEDVLVIPGEGFGPSGLGHVRLAYTIGGEALDCGLRRIRKFLKRHRPPDGEQP